MKWFSASEPDFSVATWTKGQPYRLPEHIEPFTEALRQIDPDLWQREYIDVIGHGSKRERDVTLRIVLFETFVDHHRGWIRTKVEQFRRLMDDHPGPRRLEDGVLILFRGEPTPLAVVTADRVHPKVVDGDGFRVELPETLAAPDQEAAIERTLTRWLRRQARDDAQQAIEQYGSPHGLVPSGLAIKDQKRLWGSCTASGVVNLNWRLSLAPPAVFDYVVVHELCHLRHRHHQPPFWRAVAALMPDFERHRHWLRNHGDLLTLKRR